MKDWFYVKNDLSQREDIEDIIQRPIKFSFKIQRLKCAMNDEAQDAMLAYNDVCSYIGT
jgi:hypothetical protein